jgi:hypothetical protein
MMNDNALAPVIAVMLLLAIGVTVFAVYTSTYLPGLKQQAEVEHMKEVESGFTKFSSDMDNVIARGIPNLTFSEQIPLGGGDILVNSMKSGGTIRIQNESPVGNIYIIHNGVTSPPIPVNLINFSYQPESNYWINQSYSWQQGYVNVTKGKRETPLQYYSISDPAIVEKINNFAGGLVIQTDSIGTNRTLQIIQIVAGRYNRTSSNGNANLMLTTRNKTGDYIDTPGSVVENVTCITFTANDPNLYLTGQIKDSASNIDNSIKSLGTPNNITVKVIEISVGVS